MKVLFLGQSYEFAKEVFEYGENFHKARKAAERMQGLFLQNIADQVDSKRSSLEAILDEAEKQYNIYCKEEIPKVLETALVQEAHVFVTELCKRGIYDYSENAILKGNKAYGFFSEITRQYREEMFRSLQGVQKTVADGQTRANASLDSVHGSGMSLISNSVLAHLAFAAIDSSMAQRQLEKAKKEYYERVAYSKNEASKELQKITVYYFWETYVPSMLKGIELFCGFLTEQYIDILAKAQLFRRDEIDRFDLEKCKAVLQNMKYSSEPKSPLLQAFSYAPYYTEVYLKALESGLLDNATWKTACAFGINEEIRQRVMQDFESAATQYNDDLDQCLKTLNEKYSALPDGLREYLQVDTVLQPVYRELKKRYEELQDIANDPSQLMPWIEEHFLPNEEVLKMPDVNVEEQAKHLVERLMPQAVYKELERIGANTPRNEWFNGKRAVDAADILLKKVTMEAPSQINRLQTLWREAIEAKTAYCSVLAPLEKQIKGKRKELETYKQEYASNYANIIKVEQDITSLTNEVNHCEEYEEMIKSVDKFNRVSRTKHINRVEVNDLIDPQMNGDNAYMGQVEDNGYNVENSRAEGSLNLLWIYVAAIALALWILFMG